MQVTVNVTEEDIEEGHVSNSSDCPIAKALHRMIRNHVSVGLREFTIEDHSGEIAFEWRFDNQIPEQLNANHPEHMGYCEYNSLHSSDDDYDNDEPTVQFAKTSEGHYIVKDHHNDTVIMSVAQIKKLYEISRPVSGLAWATL